ncbi:histidine kinase, partial [Streptomyces sp. Act-28]
MRGESGRLGRPGRRKWLPGVRSAAGQVLLLQVVVALVLIAAAVTALSYQARYDSERDAQNRSRAAAESFADAPGTLAALRSADPARALQRHTVDAWHGSGVDFIAVLAPDGTRIADSDPNLVGTRAEGVEQAARGRTITEIFGGSPHDAARAVVPVMDDRGTVLGLVSAGVSIENVGDAAARQLPLFFGAGAVALALATVSAALVSRRLRRQTHGLGPTEMTRMYEHHDAVLHAVREGVLIVGDDGRLTLVNDEARRLLDLPADAEGRHVTDLGLAGDAAELLASGRPVTDEVHLVGDRLLAVNTPSLIHNSEPTRPRDTI